MAAAWQLTFEQLRDAILVDGQLTRRELDGLLRLFDDPKVAFLSQVTLAAWGRRPAT